MNHYFNDLFVDQWLTKLNYSTYFDMCSPSLCSYTATNEINFSYAITLFISLYGGIIIILRWITPIIVELSFKMKDRFRVRNHEANRMTLTHKKYIDIRIFNTYSILVSYSRRVFMFAQWIERLNLFKQANEKTENHLKQQRITTHLYLMFLMGI